MGKIYEIKKVMVVGTIWCVHDHTLETQSIWRVAKNEVDGFWLEGPLDEDQAQWHLTECTWPHHRHTLFRPDGNGFTVTVGKTQVTYTRYEGATGLDKRAIEGKALGKASLSPCASAHYWQAHDIKDS